jgi:hypothetical protein
VNVGASTASSVAIAPEVWYGGSQGHQTAVTDDIPVIGTDLTIAASHTGNFTPGSTGSYSIKLHNNGSADTDSGETITVTFGLPGGFTQNSLSGTGWDCSLPMLCTTTATILSGADSNPITLVVDVAASAPDGTTSASVSAPDDLTAGNNTSNDPTIVIAKVYDITSTAADGAYKAGASLPIVLTFNTPVSVTGSPQLALRSGGTAVYASGSGASLTFGYTVQAGENDSDLEYLSSSALTLNGGTIVDAANPSVAANLGLPAPGNPGSLGFNKNISVDTTGPAVNSISSTSANGTYAAGQSIPIQIGFLEPVTVIGTPSLALNSGGTATYVSGSGTFALTFGYTVGAADQSSLLDAASASALTLNGGSIRDAAGNGATLTVPTGAAAGSLASNKTIVIANVTTITAATVTASYSPVAQSVTLSATVTSSAATVNGGTVAFTVFNSSNVQVGSSVVSGTVNLGTASASYTLPGATAAGTYSIHAAYSGAGAFNASSDNTHVLNVTPIATTTTGANATATFSAANQTVALSAAVSSSTAVNEGTVTFTVKNGAITIGSPVTSGAVSSGAASANFTLPGGTSAGSYTIQAVYNPGPDFTGSSDTTHTLTIGKATPVITWSNPADVVFGTALSGAQLNAAAGTAGTFAYTPPAGTVLSAGNGQTLATVFTPTDTTDYNSASASVLINVLPAAGPATLVMTRVLARDGVTGEVVVTVTLANTGGSAATGVQVTSAKIGATNTTTALPAPVANVPAGGSSSVVLRFPASIGAPGAAAVLSVNGVYSAGSFGGSSRVTLP